MKMMIRRPGVSKKVIVVVACAAAALVILGGLGWWWLSQKATADYRDQFASYKHDAASALNNLGKDFAMLTDYDKRIAALKTLAESAATWKNKQPAQPALLGIPLLNKEDGDMRNGLAKQLDQLKTRANDNQTLLEYEHTVATTLAEVNGKTGKNADEQKALAAAWLAMLDKLKAITPPQAAKTTHTDLLGRVSNVQAALAALPDLYTKKDYNGFAAKQGELSKYLDAIRSLSDMYKALANTQDKVLGTSYATLLNTLK